MRDGTQIKKEKKAATAQWLVEALGGQWKDNFHSDRGSTVTDECWKYLKQLRIEEESSELIKIVKQFESHGFNGDIGFQKNGKPQINFK